MKTMMLQSQVVEIMMHAANTTVLQEGTFIWSASEFPYRSVAAQCYGTEVPGYVIVNAGTNYRVGDLITGLNYDSFLSLTYRYYEHFVLRVDAVGTSGEVTSFTVLTPGCFALATANTTIQTRSVVGTGFTVQRYAGPYVVPNANTYYAYSTPPQGLVAPLQLGNYSLKQLTIDSVPFTVLELSAPEFPIVTSFDFLGPTYMRVLHMAMYHFDPPVLPLQDLGAFLTNYDYPYNYPFTFPLTQRNRNAFSLIDDTMCVVTQPNVCWQDSNGDSSKLTPDAFKLSTVFWGTDLQLAHPFFDFYFTSDDYTYQYVAEHAVFTLNYPLMLVLPSL
jgi:hypothetical protein